MSSMMYGAGEITQEVTTRGTKIPNVSIMEAVEGEGYLVTLEKHYFKELKKYLERMSQESYLQKAPILFISPNPAVSRQACAIWKKQLDKMKKQESIEEEDEDYDYDLFTIEPEFKKDSVVNKKEIMIITKEGKEGKEDTREISAMAARENIWGAPNGVESLLLQAETLLVELMDVLNPDEAVDEILNLNVPELAISMVPKESYKYIAKRLSF